MSIKKVIVVADKAPKALGPYSAAVKAGNLVFTAGQMGLDPESGEFVPGGIEAETRQTLKNIKAILNAAGSSLNSVVKTTVFLRDMNDFGVMNVIYGEFFNEKFPARSTVQPAKLPRNGAIEIEVIALLE